MPSINSTITQGLGISGGFEAPVGDTLALGYSFGTANISDADAAKIARYVWDKVLDDGYMAKELMRLFASALGGEASGLDSLAPLYKALDGNKNSITATTDEYGNRTSITLDLT